jgi:Tfp pilus assembly protein PilF
MDVCRACARRLPVIATTLILLMTPAAPAAAQSGEAAQPPDVGQAMARLQARDPEGAVKILDLVVAREPDNVTAWRMLGDALLQTKSADRAVAALERALELQPGDPAVFLSLGGAHALRNDSDRAFAWLEKARETGNVDMTRIEADANLETLRADQRYRTLLPTDAFFADPFVEPVTILREWRGEATNDQFGWIARNIGDVDGDGVPDLVTSAPTRANGGPRAGRVYVYSTLTGTLLWTVDGQPDDQLGIGIEAAGDTNGDGVPDVIASAPGRGEAYVLSGTDGERLLTFTAEGPDENFGRHVAGVGDMNGDGHADVFVGAPGRGTSSEDRGRAVVYSGRDGAVLLTLTGAEPGDAYGSTVAGDAFGDGRLLIIGAPGAGPASTGRGYVHVGLTPEPAFVIESDETGVALGAMFASVPGDVDGDGVDDVYLSDWPNSAKGRSTGRVYVRSGADGRSLHTFTGETAGEGFGTSPAQVGDVDGDGHADILVGAWQYAGAAASGGRAYLYSGRDGRLMKTYTASTPGDTFGFDAVGMGDVDGDGTMDFLITAAWSGVRGFHSGRIFLISSGVQRLSRN